MGKNSTELRREIEKTRDELGETVNAIGDRVIPRRVMHRKTARLREAMSSIKESVVGTEERIAESAHEAVASTTGAVTSAGHAVSGGAHAVAGAIHDAPHKVGDAARATPAAIARKARGHPIAAGLIAFGVGAVVAALLPSTRK